MGRFEIEEVMTLFSLSMVEEDDLTTNLNPRWGIYRVLNWLK